MPTAFVPGRYPGDEPARRQGFELAPGVREVHVQRDRVAVDEHRESPPVPHDLGRRGERHRRHQHRLPGLRPSASTARCSAAVQELTATAWGAPTAGELLLELLDLAGRS